MLFDGGAVGEGLEGHVGLLHTLHKERAGVACEELVGAGADDHGELARNKVAGVGG